MCISLKTAPGTKIRLNGKVPMCSGFLMLGPNSLTILGGTVQELYDKWKLSVVSTGVHGHKLTLLVGGL